MKCPKCGAMALKSDIREWECQKCGFKWKHPEIPNKYQLYIAQYGTGEFEE